MQRTKPIFAGELSYRTMLIPEFLDSLNTKMDGEIMPITTAVKCFNFDFNRGVLERGYGLSESVISSPATVNVWLYKRENEGGQLVAEIMFTDTDGFVYVVRNGASVKICERAFLGAVRGINYRLNGIDVILLCSSKDPLYVWDGQTEPYSVPGSPKIKDMTMHDERMFVIHSEDKNSVWFSDDLDPTNWNPSLDEGGFISFHDERGNPERVISFLGYVYVFRRYGITRVSATGSQQSFASSNLYVPSGRIYSETAALCGDRTVFLADEGLIQFDGVNITRIGKNISPAILPSANACAAYYGGKYFLACRMRFNNEEEPSSASNNALLILDMFEGKFSVSKVDGITALCALNEGGGLYAVTNGRALIVEKSGSVLGSPTLKVWETGMSDLNAPDKTKRLRQLFFRSKEDIRIKVRTEKKEKIYSVKGGDGVGDVFLNLDGKLIGISIESATQNPKISSVSIKYSIK